MASQRPKERCLGKESGMDQRDGWMDGSKLKEEEEEEN